MRRGVSAASAGKASGGATGGRGRSRALRMRATDSSAMGDGEEVLSTAAATAASLVRRVERSEWAEGSCRSAHL